MPTIQSLAREAHEAARWRGHDMTRFGPDDYWRNVRHSTCRTCNAGMSIDLRPPANGIDIGGEAVALNCPVDPDPCRN